MVLCPPQVRASHREAAPAAEVRGAAEGEEGGDGLEEGETGAGGVRGGGQEGTAVRGEGVGVREGESEKI